MIFTVLAIGILAVCSILSFIALGVSSLEPWLFLGIIAMIVFVTKYRERSMRVVWKDSYSVGIDEIDADHKKLVELINRFQAAIYYNTGSGYEQNALDDLVQYTKYHFSKEETLLEKHDYPDFAAHKKEHLEMIATVEGFIAEHRAAGYKSLVKVSDFLSDWLINHINGSDKKYSQHLQEKGLK